jgi:hypothetical protein
MMTDDAEYNYTEKNKIAHLKKCLKQCNSRVKKQL